MRAPLFLLPFVLPGTIAAQTATSVQDGLWEDPTTWDCNCIPSIINVVVDHTVQITTNTILFMEEVLVNAGGAITMDGPHSVAITETVICNGEMHLIGDIDVDGEFHINGLVTIEDELHNDNLIFMGGPGTRLMITGSIGNGGTIDGEGLICVSGITQNTGSIVGHIDICDGSPTVIDPPILDINTGTVENTVVFCATGACTQSTAERAEQPLRLFPNPASDGAWIEGVPPGAEVQVLDALGRTQAVTLDRTADRIRVELSDLAPGRYLVRVMGAAHPRCAPLILIR